MTEVNSKTKPGTYTQFFPAQAGYDFLNRWTTEMVNYEEIFSGKGFTKVSINYEDGRPTYANFHSKDSSFNPSDSIHLEGKLRDVPLSEKDFEFLKSGTELKIKNLKKLNLN